MTTSALSPRLDVPAAGRYSLDPDRSEITFRATHLFGMAPVTGTVRLSSGEIGYEPTSRQTSVTAVVAADSVSTGNARRDRDVRSAKFLGVAAHPVLTFQGGSLDQSPDGWTLTGQLRVRGISQQVTLRLESVERTGDGFRAHATASIDRYAFGVTAARGLASRFVDVTIAVAAVSQPSSPSQPSSFGEASDPAAS